MGSKNVRGRVVGFLGAGAIAAGAIAAGPASGSNDDAGRLSASLAPVKPKAAHAPGEPVTVTGTIVELAGPRDSKGPGVAATFSLRTADADGNTIGTFGPYTAADDGSVEVTLPGEATEGVEPDASTDFREVLGLELVNASYGDTQTPDGAPAGAVGVVAPPTGPILENSFVSSVGWVKPGDAYPFTLTVANYGVTPILNSVVTLTAPDSTTLTDPDGDGAAVTVSGNTLTWNAGTVPGISGTEPGETKLVVEAKADTLAQDPQVVWKDLSTSGSLTYTGAGAPFTAASHGPKVIPPFGDYETARYGDRPFPVVPVDYFLRQHDETTSAASTLDGKINDPANPGSTFNLYQEMSYGQLFPQGAVPSDGIGSDDWTYAPGFDFTQPDAASTNTCLGTTNAALPANAYQALSPNRIENGWYQLPGSTEYYGSDANGSAVIGSVAGVGALQNIDAGCGPTGKAVYDAAQIADPEIDYNEFDTDKDGVVDFFMMIFAGVGGNGGSQTEVPPYDNIWPHSSDLRGAYTDPATGLTGYISDDQLTDLEGRPLWFTDESRTQTTTEDRGDALIAFVRVGPYNVNPETAIAKASVISHEYGHSLGLPDYYSTGSRLTYGTWNLMAEDHSQNMDVIGKRELGWTIPRVLAPGTHVDANNWQDTKVNTHRIDWQQPDGTPYSLQGPSVNNGEAYVATLPGRRIIDPQLIPSGSHAYHSGAGNDFGCVPTGGHNLDLSLPQLANVPAGTPVTLKFKSNFDIEWDFDYGFVLASTDNGRNYAALPSENGYTTATSNPNANGCQTKFGNGITGSGPSYDAGTAQVDRVLGNYPDPAFVDDQYDLTQFAGSPTVLRFSYSTDPGLARPGWFIDDIEVTAGDQVIYQSDLETENDAALVNGGCAEGGLQTAPLCTDGWSRIAADQDSPAEHAYLLEMRDRSGFDADGHGEDDRGEGPTFDPGVLLTYTDENHGYGNVGTDSPPAQSPLDSQPEPGDEQPGIDDTTGLVTDSPGLDDAAYTAASGDSQFTDSGEGHVDNYSDPAREDELWRFDFNCLTFNVTRLAGAEVGPVASGSYDLNGDVGFDTGNGCGAFNFGQTSQAPDSTGPTAVAQAKPERVQVGETVAFDGSGSFDDLDASENLTYRWDFGDKERDRGRQTTHVYTSIGTYTAELSVTDSGDKTGTDTIEIKVVPSKVNRCKGLKGTVVGTPKADKLQGTKKRDVIIGLAGKDKLDGGRGRDVICGKGGDDKRLSGGEKNDKVFGGGGKDRAGGGPGRDLVNGGAGKDRLSGGGGVDRIVGGPGRDKCSGSETRDRARSCEQSV